MWADEKIYKNEEGYKPFWKELVLMDGWDENDVLMVDDEMRMESSRLTLAAHGYAVRMAENLLEAENMLRDRVPGWLIAGWESRDKKMTLPVARKARSMPGGGQIAILLLCDSEYASGEWPQEWDEYQGLITELIDWNYGRDAIYNHMRAIERTRGILRPEARVILPDGELDLEAYIVHRGNTQYALSGHEASLVRHLIGVAPGSVSSEELGRYWTEGSPEKLSSMVEGVNNSLGVDGIEKADGNRYRWVLPVKKVMN